MSEPTVERSSGELPYRLGAFGQTHPARIGAIARLFGQGAADPSRARVLEIGCGYGLNLLPLAAMFPEAQFTGIDLIAPEIAEGRRLAAAAGLTNVRLEVTDVRTFVPPEGGYDYIIAHGVFSHVPDDVKAALLACCGRALAPGGVAYISYNTYPGWKAREALRDLMNFRASGVEGAEARLANSRATLAFLQGALADAHTPAALAMRALATELVGRDSMGLYHDETGAFNDPCYLLQFVEWAAEHRLQYLGDAQMWTMFFTDLPAELTPTLAALAPNQVQAEQMMDYVRQRTFRCSLLVRADAPAPLTLTPDVLRGFAFGSALRAPVAVPDLREGQRTRFALPKGQGLETAEATTKAMLSVLAHAWPRRLPFDEVLAGTQRLLASAALPVPEDLTGRLVKALLDLCRHGLIDFLLACGLDATTRVSDAPVTDALTRTLAAKGLYVANRWHENLSLDTAMREILPRLDGTNQTWTPEEKAALERLARAGFLAA